MENVNKRAAEQRTGLSTRFRCILCMLALFFHGRMKTCNRAAIALRGLAVGKFCYHHKALQISSQKKRCKELLKRLTVQTSNARQSSVSILSSVSLFFRSPKGCSRKTQATRENRITHGQAGFLLLLLFFFSSNSQRPAVHKPRFSSFR